MAARGCRFLPDAPLPPVKLVSFPKDHLIVGEALPFGIYDGSGRLLLAGGQRIHDAAQLDDIIRQETFSEESESAEWMRKLGAAMDTALRANAALTKVANARPDAEKPGSKKDEVERIPQTLPEQWEDFILTLEGAFRDVQPGPAWLTRVNQVHERARQVATRRLDASLYYLVYTCGDSIKNYSSRHAFLTMLVCEQAATLMGWPDEWRNAIGKAALTMNVSMAKLQDMLADADMRPTPMMRADIDAHPERAVQLLQDSGIDDELWLDSVRFHHEVPDAGERLDELPNGKQLSRLLRRVDIFTAKMSRRRMRAPMSPVQAAKEACLAEDGKPDLYGSALIKALGIYPPGSFVELATGEVGVVVSRGKRANLPLVASLVTPSGAPLGEPVLRDTMTPRYAVRHAVVATRVKVRPTHNRLIALI